MLIFKVDFEKAFDSFNWDILDDLMHQMGFGAKWRLWIQGYLSTSKVSVLVNGSPTEKFTMEKDVRQGHPISPFLNILAARGLKISMVEAIDEGMKVSMVEAIDKGLFQW